MALEVLPGVIHLTDAATGPHGGELTDPSSDRATWMSFTPDGTQLTSLHRHTPKRSMSGICGGASEPGFGKCASIGIGPEFSASDPIIGR
jgi:hypothetical protein